MPMSSTAANVQREARRRAMLPGSRRDRAVKIAKTIFPVLALLLCAVLVILPLSIQQEFSFLLSKDSAMMAGERMQMQEASYRGETSDGEPFEIMAQSGVQKTSSVPIVVLTGLSASILRADGPARVTAPSGEFLIDENRLLVNGPVKAESQSGYSLDGGKILVDINARLISSDSPVSGLIPMGAFRADRFTGDVDGRRVVLEGRAHLRITPERSPT
ncbi:MAG: LPS export ABC transporter periplasmic protein LptC [Sphingomonadaceae bacterium]